MEPEPRLGRLRRRWRLLAGAVGVVAAAGVAAGLLLGSGGSSSVRAGEAVPPGERRVAPELEGEVLVGPRVRLADLRGVPVVVNFWASWCAPCREEAPELARFAQVMAGRARLVGVDFQDARPDALAFVREFGWRFPNLADPAGVLAGRYGLVGLPSTFVIDGQSRIAMTLLGPQTMDALRGAVAAVGG